MYKIDFNEPIHIHFIGIGGISMSGLAEILLKEGFTVSGSDTKESPLTKKLVSEGAHIIYGQKVENITRDIGCVVYTAAINRNNPELIEAVALKIPMLTRAELLGQLMKNYDTPIAVSGTHGKTTTTSMISHILLEGDLDPTISVGGILKAIGGNIRVGNSGTFITEACEYTNSFLHFIRVGGPELFVTEACEYTNSFLSFFPNMEIILNIEADHLDFFKDLEDIRHSFHQFAELLPEDGTLIINAEIKDYAEIYEGLSCNVVTYGTNGCFDYSAKNITYDENGHVAFDLFRRGEYADHIQLSVTGDHNVSNALSAIAVADILGLSIDITKRGLLSFTGTDRRFEYKGEFNGVTVIDDYAHHPTEILATLKAAQHSLHNSVWCVFQPHTYTRTKAFFHEFAEALSHADHLVLADIFAARETDTLGISSADLAEKIEGAKFFKTFEEIERDLRKTAQPGDLILTVGAGNVYKIGEHLLADDYET